MNCRIATIEDIGPIHDLFVRKDIGANELYTEPVTVFGYI